MEQGLEVARLQHGAAATSTPTRSPPSSSKAGKLRIELADADGKVTVLKDGVAVTEGDVLGASMMSRRALTDSSRNRSPTPRSKGVLLSLHLKATMMKVSDPIMFGHAVTMYYKDVFDKHAATFDSLGVDPDNGIGDVYKKIQTSARRHSAQPSRPTSSRLRDAPATRDGRFRARESPTCMCRAT